MRKINATLLNENNKEEAILKIKDDSFVVTTSNDLLKISHSDVKSYNYNDNNEILTITKFGGSSISLGIKKDKDLLAQLNDLVNKNKNTTDEITSKNIENNKSKKDINQNNKNNNTTNNISNLPEKKEPTTFDGIIGIIVVAIIIAFFIFIFKDFFGNNTEGIKGDVLGTYTVNSSNLKVIIKENTIVSADDENTILYDIKDIMPKGDDDYNFNLYSDDVKTAECTTTFAFVTCRMNNGGILNLTKN